MENAVETKTEELRERINSELDGVSENDLRLILFFIYGLKSK